MFEKRAILYKKNTIANGNRMELPLVLTSLRLLWRCSCRVAVSFLTLTVYIVIYNSGQELQVLTGENRKNKTEPILRLDCHRQPSNNVNLFVFYIK